MDSVADTEALAEDAPLLHRAAETLAVATRSLRRPAGSMAAVAETGNSTAVADITVAGDIMARVLDSVSAVTRHTDMPLRYVIPPDSTTSTATGNTIPVAPFLMAIEPVPMRPVYWRAAPARVKRECFLKWSWRRGLNPRPSDYKSDALPTELRQHLLQLLSVSSQRGCSLNRLCPNQAQLLEGQFHSIVRRMHIPLTHGDAVMACDFHDGEHIRARLP